MKKTGPTLCLQDVHSFIINSAGTNDLICWLTVSKAWNTMCTELLKNRPLQTIGPLQSHPSACIKIVVLGTGGTGKSSTVLQFVQNIFVEKYDPTIEESYRKARLDIPNNLGKDVILEILDTGTEPFTAMRDLYMGQGDAFLILYSITSEESFKDVDRIMEQISKVKDIPLKDIPMVLVANKSDLKAGRKVSREQGREHAQELGIAWCESCKKFP